MTDKPRDPRFLDGDTAVLTDTRDMALVVAIARDGTADITANVSHKQAAFWLRHIADQWDPPDDSEPVGYDKQAGT